MKAGRISQTALKVGLNMISLSEKQGWQGRLPAGLVEMTERLLVASGAPGHGPALMRWSKKQWMVRFYERTDFIAPGMFEGFGRRKIFLNEQALAAIEAGATQVLVIGAGFDTLCLRLAPQFPHVRFFELDHPATGAAKAKGVEEIGRPTNLTLVSADLAETPLAKAMAECDGWDTQARSFLVAEGLLMYLSEDQVRDLFQQAAACSAPASRIAFSHLESLQAQSRFARAAVRFIGEPWKFAIACADVPAFAGDLGWRVVKQADRESDRYLEALAVAERDDTPS